VNGRAPATNKQTSRPINILNESGTKIEIYWIHPDTRDAHIMSNPFVMNGASFPLNSYVGHEFEVRELPSEATGECKSEDQTCRSTYFVVSQNNAQKMTITKAFKLDFVDDQIKAKRAAGDLVQSCREKAKSQLEAAKGDGDKAMAAMDALVSCVEGQVAESLSKANEEIAFQENIRKGMGELMENYTCADETLDSSDPVRDETWRPKNGKARTSHIMLDRPASKIHVVEEFIGEEECEAMELAAKPKLHKATVADGKGGSHFSENRKAMQAGIKVHWDKEKSGDPIARLSRRVYDYVDHVLGLGIDEHGQEDLMSIQYFGRGVNDTAPDRYTPHCDGDCTGLPHKTGTRMATMVMYCTVPENGGHTNFRNANVHVKPKAGSAVFFSYIDPEELVMDTGFTEHSGCPVLEGEKKIVTQWVRLGVDANNPWTSFNTLGVKKDEEE